jgi:NADPH-dependent glutamate synthase beta subunit-like oxidoreductase
MLALGIPEFVLPKDVLEAEIGYIKDLGVDIRTNTAIGNNLTLEDLSRRGFDAVLIATGAWKSARLPIPGADLGNIFYALPLLQKARLGEKMSLKGKVAVIGGGDVAMNAARLALRLGAKEVHVAFLESRKDMPGHSWEIEAAEKEGAKLHPSLAPQQFRAKDGGKVGAIDFKRVASTQLDKEGRISWTLREGSGNDYSLDVDAVIIAIGQSPDPSFAGDGGLDVSRRGTFVVDPDTMATNVLGIFAAGDAVRMPGTVVEAMAAGRKAAASVDRYLRGQNLKAKASSGEKEILRVKPETIPDFFVRKARWDMPTLSPADATRSFAEAKLGYTLWEGVEEAKRCLNCRMCANCVFERGQICFETGSKLL